MVGRRRECIDVARILALLVVVVGHLLLAVVDRPGGDVRSTNLIGLHPGLAVLAALAPMPVFFAAGGWANSTARFETAVPRLRSLVGVATAVVLTWSAAVVLATLVAGEPGVVGSGARVATQPLWFLAAYVPMAALGASLGRLGARHPRASVGGCLAGLAALDLARFSFDAPAWVGWPGFFLAWGSPWLIGAWWRVRWEAGRLDERRTGWWLVVSAGGAAAVLVAVLGYSPALIDAVPGARSNTTPPTLYTALAGLAQVGGLMLVAPALDRAGRRWPRVWSQAGEAAVGVYVWHLTGLALAVAAVAALFPVPDRLTWFWWATRPVWWAAILTITAALVAATAQARARLSSASSRRPGDLVPRLRAALGIGLTVAAAATVGLRGPRTALLAATCTGLFACAWWLLGAGSRRSGQPQLTARV